MSARDGVIGVGDLVAVHKLSGTFLEVAAALCHDDLGQRFQSQLAGCLGACLAFGLIGQIDVLQRVGIPAVVDAVGQFGREFLLSLDGLENCGAALFQFAVIAQALVNGLDRQFVQVASRLLAVTADERDGCSVIQQIDSASHLIDGDIELL